VGNAGYGSVAYEYKIGKYEVTNLQYVAYLNAKAATDSDSYRIITGSLENSGITRSGTSGSYTYSVTGALANRPVTGVTFFDAARFANWLANGQGSGDTETGSYTFNENGVIVSAGARAANAGAQVYIPTADEWYKAAYYNAASQTYSLYPNGQNSITTADANYGNSIGSSTNVGTYSSDPSYYGTFDQLGNAWEWTDEKTYDYETARNLYGGAWDTDEHLLQTPLSDGPGNPSPNYGFRLASAVPEPSAMVLTLLGSGVMLIRRRI
jgi:formylglycine-generating enzyme required for sulfatase activity